MGAAGEGGEASSLAACRAGDLLSLAIRKSLLVASLLPTIHAGKVQAAVPGRHAAAATPLRGKRHKASQGAGPRARRPLVTRAVQVRLCWLRFLPSAVPHAAARETEPRPAPHVQVADHTEARQYIDVRQHAHVHDHRQYQEMYQRSIQDPAGFWREVATDNFHWETPIPEQHHSANFDIHQVWPY